MPTELIYKGSKFEIRSWVEKDSNVVLEFIGELRLNGNTDAERLLNMMKQTADNGIRYNAQHLRRLGKNIYEFKAPNTARVMFFYDKGMLIVCAHCFTGKKGNEDKFIKKQIERAVEIKTEYFKEKDKKDE